MSAIVANLKEYLNACLRLKNCREYKPVDQVSSVVADWLTVGQYKDYHVYLVWFAMRELLLKKFEYVDVSDVTKTFMEYPDMFAKMLNEERVPTDKMWLCRLCKDHFVYIYKIMAVANSFHRRFLEMYGEPEFTALLPDDISANLDNDDIHHLKVMPKNEVMSNIITFLQTSLNNKKWCSVPYNDQYMINLYDLVMFECENLEYSDVNVHKIWYSVKIITKHEHDILTIGFMKSGSIQKFSEENPKLFELIGNDHCFQSNEDIGMKLFNMFKQFIELNDDDKITINLPDIIVRNVFTDEDKLNLCKEFFSENQRLPIYYEVYKDFKIGEFIQNLRYCSQLKHQVEEIFHQEIRAVKVVKLSDEDKLNLCKEFFSENQRLPIYYEVYKDFKIGEFIQNLRYCSQLKPQVEEIFHQEIRAVKKISDEDKLNRCKEFYKAYKRLPKYYEVIYIDFNIGKFIQDLRYGFNSHLKPQVEEIFHQEIRTVKKISDEDKLNLCKEFYKAYKRLPKYYEVYKDFKIGEFIQNLRYGSQLKSQVEEIFHQEIKQTVTTANTENKQIDYEQKKREYDDAIEEVLELTKKLMDFIYELKSPKYESKFSYNEVVEIMSKAYDLNSALK